MSIHTKLRQGDEWFCPKCSRRWDVDDADPNECVVNEVPAATKKPRKPKRATRKLSEFSKRPMFA